MEEDKKPDRGDLIAISRGGYQHWAVYVGNGYVIHLTLNSEHADVGSCCGSSSSGSPVGQEKAIVKREKLKDVAGKDKYRIRNRLDKRREPRPIEDILRDAESRVGQTLQYNVLKNNCEHFVTLLRYGEPQSQQAQKAETAALGTVGTLIGAVVAIGIGVVVKLILSEPEDQKKQKEKK